MSNDEQKKPKGTEYGFPALAGDKGEDTQRGRPKLPTPHGRAQTPSAPEREDGDGPLLRRVEHELAQPPRFSADTETGRSILREDVVAPIELTAAPSADSPSTQRPDLLRAPSPSLITQAISAVTWTRARLLTTIAVVVTLIGVTLLLLTWRCGGWSTPMRIERAKPAARAPRPAAVTQAPPPRPEPPREPSRRPSQDLSKNPSAAELSAALTRAREAAEENRCPEAAAALTRLVGQRLPAADSAMAHYYLGRSLVCLSRFDDGLKAYRRAISLNPAFRKDARLLSDLAFLLTRKAIRRKAAIFLAENVGAPAIDLLLGAATNEDREVRRSAVSSLEKLGAAARIDWQTVLWLDLQQTPCAQRPPIIARIAKLPRARASKLLLSARSEKRHACVRTQIDAAIAALQSGAKKKTNR